MQACGGAALHLDDADMQGVSHGRREVSLNHDSSGASHKQTTRVVNRFQLWSGGTSICWRPAMELRSAGSRIFGFSVGPAVRPAVGLGR